jgi:2-polyprenyl-6-hydroxyphenyl methylase/3-demethylubiquinone-9 3-methyltransferase
MRVMQQSHSERRGTEDALAIAPSNMAVEFEREVRSGERFQFGRNWTSFLKHLNGARIAEAQRNLTEFLGEGALVGKTFLDIGSGSGLSSLAARRLGAIVTSFDFDPQCVACTKELKSRFLAGDRQWTVEQGTILDKEYCDGLGQFDIVYSWGVLHHTGAMWQAMQNVKFLVKPGGLLFIAIYNDCGAVSRWWHHRKRRYNALPRMLRPLYVIWIWIPVELRLVLGALRAEGLRAYSREVRRANSLRGMSRLHDIVDWVGGYPYEYATVEAITDFYGRDDFEPVKVRENRSYGCHQLVFRRRP